MITMENEPTQSTPVYHEVIKDMLNRAEFGKAHYGKYLYANNGRDSLQDAYEEALDLTCYLKQVIIERNNK